jgi:hypothetical protein
MVAKKQRKGIQEGERVTLLSSNSVPKYSVSSAEKSTVSQKC